MNPFDYAQAFAAMWTEGGQALLKAQAEAGQAFADGVKAMGEPAGGGAELVQAGRAMAELWGAASSLSTALAARVPAGETGDVAGAAFRQMLDPRAWLAGGGEMDEMLGRMAEGPRFADLFDMERRHARVTKAWVEVRRRSLEHSGVVLQAWMRAARRFGEASAGPEAKESRAMLKLWTEVANRELLETQRSEAFLASQSAAIRASTELRLAQQELVEQYGRQYGFPTRTELDDVHRTVTELRREVRALKREARRVPEPAPEPAAALDPARAAPRPVRVRTTARRS